MSSIACIFLIDIAFLNGKGFNKIIDKIDPVSIHITLKVDKFINDNQFKYTIVDDINVVRLGFLFLYTNENLKKTVRLYKRGLLLFDTKEEALIYIKIKQKEEEMRKKESFLERVMTRRRKA